MFAHGETVVRLRAQTRIDPYSQEPVPVWDDPSKPPDELQIPGCAFNPGPSGEAVEVGRQPVTTTPTVYGPFGADITAGDRLVVRGRVWLVDGDPALWRNPFTGTEFGLAVTLKAVSG